MQKLKSGGHVIYTKHMPTWFFLAFLTMIGWGLWGFFLKLASVHLHPYQVLFFTMLMSIPIAFLALLSGGFPSSFFSRGSVYALAGGLCMSVSYIPFVFAMRSGKVSVVVAVTALYPLVTIILAYFLLQEEIGIRQVAGITSALLAMFLLAL